jgi:hypothetical protein
LTAGSTGDVVDLDIACFRVTKQVHLSRGSKKIKPKKIHIKLTVQNNGAVDEPRTATVVGVQNGVEIYNESLEVSAPPDEKAKKTTVMQWNRLPRALRHRWQKYSGNLSAGHWDCRCEKSSQQTFRFPPFRPATTGDITWTVTIFDDDPDCDGRIAITKVKGPKERCQKPKWWSHK